MQVKEPAELTGTTVRTIRYDHQVGLRAVQPVRDGRRDYDVSHLARVGRVRWLADSGLPLAQISAALSVPRDPARGVRVLGLDPATHAAEVTRQVS